VTSSEVKALAIGLQACSPGLVEDLKTAGVVVLAAVDRREAQAILEAESTIQLVLTPTALPDGSWADVLRDVAKQRPAAQVVVVARLADSQLWLDVLDAGAYDLLVEPCGKEEALRIVQGAVMRNRLQDGARETEPERKHSERAAPTASNAAAAGSGGGSAG